MDVEKPEISESFFSWGVSIPNMHLRFYVHTVINIIVIWHLYA